MPIMIKRYTIAEAEEWDKIVRTFPNHDIYYFSGYVRAFSIHGDGEGEMLYYKQNQMRAIYVYMKRSTALQGWYDTITPYGYGGVLFDGNYSPEELLLFNEEFRHYMYSQHIVDNFVRFHPILGNAEPMKAISHVIDLGHTIAMDLQSPEIIWKNIISKNRNMIRKAQKNGIEIHHGQDISLFADFQRIYNATMDRDHAERYYYFSDAFYQSIHRDLKDHYQMFYATYQGQIIAMSIILYANRKMHYHLSGSVDAYRHLAPTNLLLYEAAMWGYDQGFSLFHLGGGVGSGEDNLYKFKAAFAPHSTYQFAIGKDIYEPECYQSLVRERAERDPHFDPNSHFFPLYRS